MVDVLPNYAQDRAVSRYRGIATYMTNSLQTSEDTSIYELTTDKLQPMLIIVLIMSISEHSGFHKVV